MIPKAATLRNSVTMISASSHPHLFDHFNVFTAPKVNEAETQLTGQKRRDPSMSSDNVQKMLSIAASRGMTQTQFESITRKLNPARSQFAGSLRGTLWNHYMRPVTLDTESPAQMSCENYLNYLEAFHKRGWLTREEGAECAALALAIKVQSKFSDQVKAREEFVRELLRKKFRGVDKRIIGAFLKNAKASYADQYQKFLEELPGHLDGLEKLGESLERFGTNLSH